MNAKTKVNGWFSLEKDVIVTAWKNPTHKNLLWKETPVFSTNKQSAHGALPAGVSTFNFSELSAATNSFAFECKIKSCRCADIYKVHMMNACF